MKLPRDVSGQKLSRALARLGYRIARQRGSHVHLISQQHGEHHLVIPAHDPLKAGTLAGILKSVADHFGMSREELIELLEI